MTTEHILVALDAGVVEHHVASPSQYSTKHYRAFRVSGGEGRDWRTSEIEFDGAPANLDETLPAILTTGTPGCFHKDRLLIEERDSLSGTVSLHIYAIKKKAPRWVHPAGEIMPRRIEEHFADHVCTIDRKVIA